MSKQPIEIVLDRVDWRELPPEPPASDGLPWATHSGVLEIGGAKIRCYRLSNGQAVFDADDLRAFVGAEIWDALTGRSGGEG